jgi:hypothetical protein
MCDPTTRSSVHTLAEADTIGKRWGPIGKKVPIVDNHAHFYRTPATATTDPTQILKVLRAGVVDRPWALLLVLA